MKKALAILMVLALVASAATAEITFGAWGRGLFIPVMNSGADDEDSSATTAISWGKPNPRIGMTIKGVSENAGFQIDWNSDGASFGISDQNKIWIKPVSMVTVSIGRVFDDTLRGNACFGSWDWYRAYSVVNTIGEEDFTFTRVDTKNQGFVVSVAPMDALYLVASFNDLGTAQKTEYLLGDFQFQAGYTIANIGQIRAGYIAVQTDEDEATGVDAAVDGKVEVAFKLTAMENLYVDFGVRIPTNTSDFEVSDVKDISVYANYKMDAFKFHVIGQYKIVGIDGLDNGFMMGAGAEYALANNFSVDADILYMSSSLNETVTSIAWYKDNTKTISDDAVTTFYAGIVKGFSNGSIGAGLQVMSGENTGYAIPVRLQYSF